jgi:hypothetical protein
VEALPWVWRPVSGLEWRSDQVCASKSYQKLPEVTRGYQRLPKLPEVTKSYQTYQKLLNVTRSYQTLPEVTKSYQKLPKVIKRYQKLPKVNRLPKHCPSLLPQGTRKHKEEAQYNGQK